MHPSNSQAKNLEVTLTSFCHTCVQSIVKSYGLCIGKILSHTIHLNNYTLVYSPSCGSQFFKK